MRDKVLAEWATQLANITLPRPFDLDTLLASLSDARSRGLEISTADLGRDISGLWIPYPDHDTIYLSEAVATAQHEPIILHEVGHMVCGHPHDPQTTHALRRRLAPLIDVTQWDSAFARASYLHENERAAERFARAVSTIARRDRRLAAQSTHDTRKIISPLLDIFG